MNTGFWNYTEKITYRVVVVKLLAMEKPPAHWQNAFAGEHHQAIEVTRGKDSFLIDNEDGSALHKILNGGGPDSMHRSIAEHEFISEQVDEEVIEWDYAKSKSIQAAVDEWQQRNCPVEYERIKALIRAIVNKDFMPKRP